MPHVVNNQQTIVSGRAVHQWPPPVAPSAVQVAYLVQKSSAIAKLSSAIVSQPSNDASKEDNITSKFGIGNKNYGASNCDDKMEKESSGEAIQDESKEKSSALSVKDIIKRLQNEKESNPEEAVNHNPNRIVRVEEKAESDSSHFEKECVTIQSDVNVEDLESAPNDDSPDGNGVYYDKDTHTKGPCSSSRSNSTSSSPGDLDPTGSEGMMGDLELTWQNETVLENSLRQAVAQMLHPPPVHCLYPEECEDSDGIGDALLGLSPSIGDAPSLNSSLKMAAPDGLLDARSEAWQEDPGTNHHTERPHEEAARSSEEQVFIPIDAYNVSTSSLNPPLMSPRRVTSSFPDVTSPMEEMALTSDFLLSNDTVIEAVKVKDVQIQPDLSFDSGLGVDDVKELNKILDELDAVLLSELSSELTLGGEEGATVIGQPGGGNLVSQPVRDNLIGQTEHLYRRLSDLSTNRHKVMVEAITKRNKDGMLIEEAFTDCSYDMEVSEMNKNMADSLTSPLRTVNEEEIRAIVANHQQQQRQIFSKFFSNLSKEEETNANSPQTPQNPLTEGMSSDEKQQPGFNGRKVEMDINPSDSKQEASLVSNLRVAKLEPELAAKVDVLSQLVDHNASELPSVPLMKEAFQTIWMPKFADLAGSGLPTSPTTTSTTTFRIGQSDNSRDEQNSSSDCENPAEDIPTGVSLSEVGFSLAMGSESNLGQVADDHVTISLPSNKPALTTSRSDNNNEQYGHSENIKTVNSPQDNIVMKCDTEKANIISNTDGKKETMNTTFVTVPGTFKMQTFSRVNVDDPDDEENTSMCGTFVMKSAVVDTHTFSRVKVEEDNVSGSESDAMSCSDDESSAILTDGDEDDDMRRLQQRYGEILQWSDTEKLSGESDDDGSVDDLEETEEEVQLQENLEQSMKLSLTMDIKDKLPTLTEKDFSNMMSDYRQVLKQAERNNFTIKEDFETARSWFEKARSPTTADDADTDEEGEGNDDSDGAQYLQTVMFQPKQTEVMSPSDIQTGDSGLGEEDTLRNNTNHPAVSCDMSTGMEGTLVHTQHTLNTCKFMCDASTSMGAGTLRACLGRDDVQTSETAVMTSESGVVTSESSVMTLTETPVVTSQNTSETQTERGAVTKDAIVGGEDCGYSGQDQDLTAAFREISQDLETSDREMVDTLVRSTHVGGGGEQLPRQWTEVLTEYIEQSETVRVKRQQEAQRQAQRLQSKLLQACSTSTQSGTNAEKSQKTSSSSTTSTTESQTPGVQVAMVGIQVEQDMLRLKEDLLSRIRSKDEQQVLDQEEMMKIFTEYRQGQRRLVERRLSDKARANQKLQERLQAKREQRKAREKAQGPSIKDKVREMDDAFYSDLCERQRTLNITNEELRDLVSRHVDETEQFRRKLEEEVAKTRQEAIQRRLAQTEENVENKERDVSLANELVQKDKENADIVKNVRDRERARFDEKLKLKLAERKRRKHQKDMEGEAGE